MFCLRTSAVECTHRSLLEELWLRVHRSLHQEERLLKYNGKGRITQNTAEQSTVKESNAFKILRFSYLRTPCLMTVRGPKRYIILPHILHYIQLHYNSHCIYNTYTLEDSSTHTCTHRYIMKWVECELTCLRGWDSP